MVLTIHSSRSSLTLSNRGRVDNSSSSSSDEAEMLYVWISTRSCMTRITSSTARLSQWVTWELSQISLLSIINTTKINGLHDRIGSSSNYYQSPSFLQALYFCTCYCSCNAYIYLFALDNSRLTVFPRRTSYPNLGLDKNSDAVLYRVVAPYWGNSFSVNPLSLCHGN